MATTTREDPSRGHAAEMREGLMLAGKGRLLAPRCGDVPYAGGRRSKAARNAPIAVIATGENGRSGFA